MEGQRGEGGLRDFIHCTQVIAAKLGRQAHLVAYHGECLLHSLLCVHHYHIIANLRVCGVRSAAGPILFPQTVPSRRHYDISFTWCVVPRRWYGQRPRRRRWNSANYQRMMWWGFFFLERVSTCVLQALRMRLFTDGWWHRFWRIFRDWVNLGEDF